MIKMVLKDVSKFEEEDKVMIIKEGPLQYYTGKVKKILPFHRPVYGVLMDVSAITVIKYFREEELVKSDD